MRYAIYDYDDDSFLGGTYSRPQQAADNIDDQLNNCMVVAVDIDNDLEDFEFECDECGEWESECTCEEESE